MTVEDVFIDTFNKFRPHVSKEARRWGFTASSEPSIEDIYSMVMLRIWQYRSTSLQKDDAGNIDGWINMCVQKTTTQVLCTIVGYNNKDRTRSGKRLLEEATNRYGLFEENFSAQLPAVLSAESQYLKSISSTQSFWEKARTVLNEREYECVSLRYLSEYDYDDISLKTDLQLKTIERAVSSAIRKLRNHFNPGQDGYPSAKLTERKSSLSTHCVNDHEYTVASTAWEQKKGRGALSRRCKKCSEENTARYLARKALADG